MIKVRILVQGCDDTTAVDMEVNDAELDVLKRFAALTRLEAVSGCQPKVAVGQDEIMKMEIQ